MMTACRATDATSAAGGAIFPRCGARAGSLIVPPILSFARASVESRSEAPDGIFRRDLCHVLEGRTPQLGDAPGRVDDVGRLVRRTPLRDGGEIRAVRFDEDALLRREPGDVVDARGVLE